MSTEYSQPKCDRARNNAQGGVAITAFFNNLLCHRYY